ncbi:MAG TPA: hypothetical protein VM282_25075 [Acidimicrobiales bacterium]|nr:hypothetical protein [Acidimicrobiales bacterium]
MRYARPARFAGCAAVVTAIGFVPSGGVDACSLPEMPHIEDVVPDEPIRSLNTGRVLGIYEIEHIAYAGWFGSERSVTVVTRYWGTPPDETGPLMRVEGCGTSPAGVGERGYGWVDTRTQQALLGSRISRSLRGTDGGLSFEQEVMLVERFGPPVTLEVSTRDRLVAAGRVWRLELLVIVAVTGVAVLLLRRHRRARRSARTQPHGTAIVPRADNLSSSAERAIT